MACFALLLGTLRLPFVEAWARLPEDERPNHASHPSGGQTPADLPYDLQERPTAGHFLCFSQKCIQCHSDYFQKALHKFKKAESVLKNL